ncbi:ferredoxin [Nocardioides mangrovicus]|uniref:Ferredoxin n=1 Tax=Nocardioides mangrovicus TaxID=2478913 RepID=A0A3L8NXM7_9ACTN|nr:ferredoxin [Nocardioides mangrovicus]RLV47452.1 ferredoxin [Nocardioides mangrovicus]
MSDHPPFKIDEEFCVGHGRCYALAPESFQPDEMGHGVVRDYRDGPATREPGVVVNACPESAIELITVGGDAEKGSQS